MENLGEVFDPTSISFWQVLIAVAAIGLSLIGARYVRRAIRRTMQNYETVDEYAGAIIGCDAGWAAVLLGIVIAVAYDADIDEVQRLLTAAAASVDGVREHPAPSAWIASLGDSAIDVELRFWTDYVSRHTVPSVVAREALGRLDAAKVNMPLPTQHIVITGVGTEPSDDSL